MSLGHYGVALGAKKVQPKISLGTLLIAAQFSDLLWPTLLLLGIEKVEIKPGITKTTPLDFTYYPYSHSLLMAIVWGVILGIVFWRIRKNVAGAIVISLCVISHWILDLIVHRPDLQLYPGNQTRVGFGLWNSAVATHLLEAIFFFGGMFLYLSATKAKNKIGSWAFWSFIAFMILGYLINVFSPPPTSVTALAWTAQFQWLLVIWAYWLDRNRTAVAG
ncbi:MAG: metal-dependent hydrolase [Chitinophagales bacterium]